MKKLFVITLGLTLCTSAAMADFITVAVDPTGADCALETPAVPPAVNTFYVVHKLNAGATAVQFKVTDQSGLFAASQTVTSGYLSIGNWFTDMSIAFPSCVIGDHVLGTLDYFWFGTTFTCSSTISIDPAPTSPIPGSVVIVDCNQPFGNLEAAGGSWALVYPDPPSCSGCICCNATSESTWGSIKALYR